MLNCMSTAKLFSFSARIFMYDQQNIAHSIQWKFFLSKNEMENTKKKNQKGIDRLDHWHDSRNNLSSVFAHRRTSAYK